jgi:pentatricopeptide repeat protein
LVLINTLSAYYLSRRDESYATIIRAAGADGDLDQAKNLLFQLESGEIDGVEPGMFCYEAFLEACARNNSWNEIHIMYDNMLGRGVIPSTKSDFFQIQAHYQTGGRPEAFAFLKTILSRNTKIDRGVHVLILKIVFPDFVKSDDGNMNIDACRQHLIEESKVTDDTRKVKSMQQLVRSLHVASHEEQRHTGTGLSLEDLETRRDQNWRQVLLDLVAYNDEDNCIEMRQ